MTPRALVCVPGTWGFDGDLARLGIDWWQPDSRLAQYLATQGYVNQFAPRTFTWSTALDIGKPLNWKSGGITLFVWLVPPLCPEQRVRPDDTRVLAHSHGGQAALYAAGVAGLKIQSLVTVSTPVRRDVLRDVMPAARENIGHWTHFYSEWDWTQAAGSVLDGRLGVFRQMPDADVNIMVPKAGHSKLLHDPVLGGVYWPLLAAYLGI